MGHHRREDCSSAHNPPLGVRRSLWLADYNGVHMPLATKAATQRQPPRRSSNRLPPPAPRVRSDTHPKPPSHLRLEPPVASPIRAIDRSVLICGSAENALDLLPRESVQTVITSPPYWSLRDYGTSGQIGCDDALSEYTGSLVRTFRKVRQALRPDGTLWLNIGDSYTSGNRRYRAPDREEPRAGDVDAPADPGGIEAERPHRRALANRPGAARGRVVAAV